VRELAKQQAAGLKQSAYPKPVASTGGVSTLTANTAQQQSSQPKLGLPALPQYDTQGKVLERAGPPAPTKENTESISDLMARVRAANPQLDWSKYRPPSVDGMRTMEYNEFDRARDQYLKSLSGNVQPETKLAAQGGLMNLAKGRYLNGATDGMADKIPAHIEGKQPAALSHGEFVVPADVVSHLGNGNSEAGAQRLYDMMDRIRKARTGTTKQGKQINPDKFMPK
jgi:hypothetical protein